MQRLPDWRARLCAYVTEIAREPFRAGRHDCALFAAGAVAAITGQDPAAAYRGKYRSLKKGHALLAAEGTDMVAMAAALFKEIPPIFAQVGDVAIVQGAGGEAAFGIVQGPMIYVVTPEHGLGLVALTDAQRAFRV